MRRKSSGDSSLELLLDTMCNTFGCIMFIAIALTVIVSSAKIAESAFNPAEQAKAMLKEISRLEKILDDMIRDSKEKEAAEKELANDPRRKLIGKLTLVEQKAKAAEMKLGLLEPKKILLAERKEKLEKELQKIKKKKEELEDESDNLYLEESRLKKECSEMRRSPTVDSIQLKTLSGHSGKSPFFILVERGLFWKAGPIRHADGKITADTDVLVKIGDNTLTCRPDPAKGSPLLNGRELSEPLKDLLKGLPENRIAHFSVKADSAADFYRVRERLKDEGILHGFDTEFERRKKDFVIYLTPEGVVYEY